MTFISSVQPTLEIGTSNLGSSEEASSGDVDAHITQVLKAERTTTHLKRYDHVVAATVPSRAVPHRIIATTKEVVGTLWQEIRPEPLSDIITLDGVRDSFSAESQSLLNERLRADQSFADRDRLARLYGLIKKAILLPRDSLVRNRVALAIERELRPLGLTHSWHPSFHVEVVRGDVYGHKTYTTSTEEGMAVHDRIVWRSLATEDVFIPVRDALDNGQVAIAVNIIFDLYLEAAPETETRQARLEKIWSGILFLLPPEEQRELLACIEDASLLAEIVVVVGESCARRNNIRDTDMAGYRLARALAGAPAETLSEVMARLLATPETEGLTAWLLNSANLFGTFADTKTLMETYDVAVRSYPDCYSAEQVILRQSVRETETKASRLDPIGRTHQILRIFGERTRQHGGYVVRDERTIKKNLRALRDLLPQCPRELRQRVMQILVDHYPLWALSQSFRSAYWDMIFRWQPIVEDEELQERIELLTIRFAPAEKSFEQNILTVKDQTLKDIVNARNRNSRAALYELIRPGTDLRDVNLAGFYLSGLVDYYGIPKIGRVWDRVTVTEDQFLLIAQQCAGLEGIVVVGDRNDFIDGDLTLTQKLGCWEAGIPLSPKQEEELIAEILDPKRSILNYYPETKINAKRAKEYLIERLRNQEEEPTLTRIVLDALETACHRPKNYAHFMEQIAEILTQPAYIYHTEGEIINNRLRRVADVVKDETLEQYISLLPQKGGNPHLREALINNPRLGPIMQAQLPEGNSMGMFEDARLMAHTDPRVRGHVIAVAHAVIEDAVVAGLKIDNNRLNILAKILIEEDDYALWQEAVKTILLIYNQEERINQFTEYAVTNARAIGITASVQQKNGFFTEIEIKKGKIQWTWRKNDKTGDRFTVTTTEA